MLYFASVFLVKTLYLLFLGREGDLQLFGLLFINLSPDGTSEKVGGNYLVFEMNSVTCCWTVDLQPSSGLKESVHLVLTRSRMVVQQLLF